MQFRKDLPAPGGGTQNYLKLKDRESVKGIFMGDVHEFFTTWNNQTQRSEVVPEGTPKSKFRFRVNFVTKEGAVYVPKIFENGAMVYQQLADLHEEYKLDSIVVKITRNGTGMDTTYSIMPMLKDTLSKETLTHLKQIELLQLEPGGQNESNSSASSDEDESVPF